MLFDSSVRKELARSFGATLVVLLTIVLTNYLIRTIGQAASGAVAPQDVVLLLGYLSLGVMPTVMALSFFVAVVLSLGRLYRDSEMAVWQASGVGLSRFVRPVLRTGWPVLAVIGLLLLVAWPWGNRNSLELRDRYQQRSDLARVTPGVFQSSADGSRVFFVERESVDGIHARNVFILTRQPEAEAVTSAHQGRLLVEGSDTTLELQRGQRNEVHPVTGVRTLSAFETYQALVSERAARGAESQPPKAMETLQLIREASPRQLAELVWRVGMLCAAANLCLLGVGLAATNPRRASNWNLLFALLTFAVYYNLVNLSQAWVAGERLHPVAALLSVHGTAFIVALSLIWWRDHAAAAPWRRRGARSGAGVAGAAGATA